MAEAQQRRPRWPRAGLLIATSTIGLALLVALVAPGTGGDLSRGSTSASPSAAPAASAGAPPPLCTARTATTYEADRIVENGPSDQYPVARRVYENVLEDVPGDACATRGLARLAYLDTESAAAAKNRQSWAERAGANWRDAQKRLLAGWGTLAGVAAGVLVLLLLLARLATPWFVRPGTLGSRRLRWLIWILGLLLTAAASVTPLIIGATRIGRPSSVWWIVGPLAVTLGALLLLIPLARGERGALTLALATATPGLAAIVLILSPASTGPGVTIDPVLILGAAAAVTGVAWVAFGRGTSLALDLRVHGAGGAIDLPAGQLLLARLTALGTQRPRGLRSAGPSDVSNLPEDALTTVPSGSWATLLFNVLKVLRPATPWQVTATLPAADRITWSITRNGVATAHGAQVVTSPLVPAAETAEAVEEKSASSADRTKDELLTACAADVLVTMSEVHRHLRKGLCGATSWRSLALHAVAVRESTSIDRRRGLLLAALDADPDYALAQLAWVNALEDKDSAGRLRYARALHDLEARGLGFDADRRQKISPGYEAYQLRLFFNIAVAWLNVRKDREIARARPGELLNAWTNSARAALHLLGDLEEYRSEPTLAELIRAMGGPSENMILELAALRPGRCERSTGGRTVADLAGEIRRARREIARRRTPHSAQPSEPVNRAGFYSRACLFITWDKTDLAMRDLQVSATDSGNKEWARYDPYFHRFRLPPAGDESDEDWVSYAEAVGQQPAADFMELSPFEPYAKKLTSHGFRNIERLSNTSKRELISLTGAPPAAARSMLDAARLATRANRDRQVLDTAILQVLLSAGVTSLEELRLQISTPAKAESFYHRLVTAAAPLSVVPRRVDTVDRWR